MSDQTKGGIAWTDETWNPTRGCSRVSAGCEHCYAEGVARRFAGPGQPYEGLVRIGKDGKPKAQWNGVVRLVPEHLADPLRWRDARPRLGRPLRVFVNSMSDLFHEALPFESIAAVFGVMAASPKHTFQVLTKRPARAREFFAWALRFGELRSDALRRCREQARRHGVDLDLLPLDVHAGGMDWPLPNVWLGVSVEDQQRADERIPLLLETPAAVRFVSYEPAIGPVDFTALRTIERRSFDNGMSGRMAVESNALSSDRDGYSHGRAIDWIIVGGESGPGARPFDLAWARSTIAQCKAAGVRAFFKQAGSRPMLDGVPLRLRDRKGGDLSDLPPDLHVREFPDAA